MERYITLPLTEELAKSLHAGDSVYVTGTIYTSRDAGHKRMCEALARGEELPFDPTDATIYYVGKVVATAKDTSLIEVELLTGRTHQIRAHMAYIGHPLVGDGKYGVNRDDRARGYKYQALYSYKLRFAFTTDAGILPLDA